MTLLYKLGLCGEDIGKGFKLYPSDNDTTSLWLYTLLKGRRVFAVQVNMGQQRLKICRQNHFVHASVTEAEACRSSWSTVCNVD